MLKISETVEIEIERYVFYIRLGLLTIFVKFLTNKFVRLGLAVKNFKLTTLLKTLINRILYWN